MKCDNKPSSSNSRHTTKQPNIQTTEQRRESHTSRAETTTAARHFVAITLMMVPPKLRGGDGQGGVAQPNTHMGQHGNLRLTIAIIWQQVSPRRANKPTPSSNCIFLCEFSSAQIFFDFLIFFFFDFCNCQKPAPSWWC